MAKWVLPEEKRDKIPTQFVEYTEQKRNKLRYRQRVQSKQVLRLLNI